MSERTKLYLLTHDWAMNFRSDKESTGAVVTSLEEAKKWVKDRDEIEYGYEELRVFDSAEDALEWINQVD